MSLEKPPQTSAAGGPSPEFSDLPALWQVERLQTVYQLTGDMSRARALHEIYEAALHGLERALATPRASILLFDSDEVMRFKAWHGLSDPYRRAVEGHTPWSRDVVDPKPIVVRDVEADEAFRPFADTFRAEGIRVE